MLCPSCNGQIYPFAKDFVCPHCFLQLKVQKLKRLTVLMLPDNRLAGIYNESCGRLISFMKFAQNPPIEKKELHRQQAIASLKIQTYLNQISTTLQTLKSERQTLLDAEIVVERVLFSSFANQQQSSLCRSQIALAHTLIEELEEAYIKLRDNLEQAVAQIPGNLSVFKEQIQQQVQFVRQLELQKNSALRGID